MAFPYGTPAGDLANVKLVATSQIDAKNPKSMIRADEIPVALQGRAGRKAADGKAAGGVRGPGGVRRQL